MKRTVQMHTAPVFASTRSSSLRISNLGGRKGWSRIFNTGSSTKLHRASAPVCEGAARDAAHWAKKGRLVYVIVHVSAGHPSPPHSPQLKVLLLRRNAAVCVPYSSAHVAASGALVAAASLAAFFMRPPQQGQFLRGA